MDTMYVRDENGSYVQAQDKALMEAGYEAAKRAFKPGQEISGPKELSRVLPALLAGKDHEVLYAMFLTVRREVLGFEPMFRGTIDETPNFFREIVKRALELNAKNLILVHNHPSGYSEPSHADKTTTVAADLACKLFQMELLDHVVVGIDGTTSIKEKIAEQMMEIAKHGAVAAMLELARKAISQGEPVDPNEEIMKLGTGKKVHDRR